MNKAVRLTVVIIAAVIISVLLMGYRNEFAVADTSSEMKRTVDANNALIEEKKQRLDELKEDSHFTKEYLNLMIEKMDLQQQNIDVINRELSKLDTEIAEVDMDILVLQSEIDTKKERIDAGIENFKLYLRDTYMNSSDGIFSVLVGVTDFYDLMARSEFTHCIAKYNNKMVEELNEEIKDYTGRMDELVAKKSSLEDKRQTYEGYHDMLEGEMNALIDEYYEPRVLLQELMATQQLTQSDIDWLDKQNDILGSRIEAAVEQERLEAEKTRKAAQERQNARQQSGSQDFSKEVYTGDRQAMIDYAKTYLGIWYQWCGSYPKTYGLDCSHFTWRVAEHFGLMPYYMDSRAQRKFCVEITRDELQPGDLIFYKNGSGRVVHVTMYIGNGQIIGANGGDSWVDTESEAKSCNAKVKIVSLDSDRRSKIYGRLPGIAEAEGYNSGS